MRDNKAGDDAFLAIQQQFEQSLAPMHKALQPLIWGGLVFFDILVIYVYLLAPDPSHLSRCDMTYPVSKSSHLWRYDMTSGPTSAIFRSARSARCAHG